MLKMKENLKKIGWPILSVGIMIGLFLIAALFIAGGVWLSEKVYPWLETISFITLLIAIFVLLPSAFFSSTPRFAGNGMVISSYVFGVTLWVWSLLLTYVLWGGMALLIGLFMMGIGVVPIAMLATLFKGMWSTLGQLVLLLALTFGIRFWGYHLLGKAEETASVSVEGSSTPKSFRNRRNQIFGIVLVLLVIVGVIWFLRKTDNSGDYYWMMKEAPPDNCVRVWIPVHGVHEKSCDLEPDGKMTPAMALATILTLQYKPTRYDIKTTNKGIEVKDDLGSVQGPVHYHGVYVDLETARRLLESNKWGWSPDCVVQEVAFDLDKFTIDLYNRGSAGDVLVTISDKKLTEKDRKTWEELAHFEAGEYRKVTIATPGIHRGEDAFIAVLSRVDRVYYGLKDNNWQRTSYKTPDPNQKSKTGKKSDSLIAELSAERKRLRSEIDLTQD